ncbi:MAG: hypothetical protein ACRESX_03205 [Gammaproteobacteria bacterium]
MKIPTGLSKWCRLNSSLVLLLTLGLFFAGCGSNNPGSLTIKSWGPNSTQAGVVFNVQPDGVAAFWVNVDRDLTGNAYISFNGVKLKSAVSGKLITAGVPANLYAQAGSYPLYVVYVGQGTEIKSNSVVFKVTPK